MGYLFLLALLTALPPASTSATDDRLVSMYVRNGVAELGLDTTTPEGRERIARLERAVRDELRDRTLVTAEARRRNLPVDTHVESRRDRWIARLGGEAGYRSYLSEHGLGDADVARLVEQEIAAELLREALTRDVRVSADDVSAFYERERTNPAMRALFVEPEKVSAAHILVAARPGVHADIDVRRQRAERIRRELAGGGDFAALAAAHSDDAGTRARGGYLGWFTRDTHAAAFDAAAFALAPGTVSPVIRSEYGFHVIRVEARASERMRTLDELRSAIEAHLVATRAAAHMKQWLHRRRAESAAPANSRQE